jgi:AcrR family transcriptional regulator
MSLDTDAVLDEALRLLERGGDGALGFNRLARALGVKPPSLYNHVAGDADLRRRVAIRGWALFDAGSQRRARGLNGEDTLRAFAKAYREFAHSHPGLFGVMSTVRLAPADKDFSALAAPLLDRISSPIRDLGVQGGDVLHGVRAFRAAVHGFVVLERQQQFAMDASVKKSFDRLIDILLLGIRAGPGSGKRALKRGPKRT